MLVACGSLVAVTALVWPREKEPEYQGKKLSYWCARLGSTDGSVSGSEFSEAEQAIIGIGTNGVPFLLKWTRYERPRWKSDLASGHFLPGVVRRNLLMRWLDGETEEFRGYNAQFGFHALGPRAGPAVPELCRIARGTQPSAARDRAAAALQWVAPEMLAAPEVLETNGVR
jgi:hypothetical protein